MGGLLGGGATTGPIVIPTVSVGSGSGTPVSDTVRNVITRVVVDTHVHLPDMFEIRFSDETGGILDQAGIDIGATITIAGGAVTDSTAAALITGEVTAIEAVCVHSSIETVVRGYEKAHRLQRGRRSRTFLNMTDSDIAQQVASDAGLDIGTVDDSSTTWDHVAQVAQTDWEFLNERAQEIGYETGVTQGKFYFRKGSDMPADSGGGLGGALGGLASAAVSAVAGALGLGGNGGLTFKKNLLTFLPRISGANLTPDVEVRVWDPKTARVAVGTSDLATKTATIDGEDPADLANAATDGLIPPIPGLPALPAIPGLPKLDFGSAPSNTAYVVVDRPLAVGSAADGAADATAKSLSGYVASTFAEAEGVAQGSPTIQAGATVQIDGVPQPFVGSWVVTQARHVFDPSDLGYLTHFVVSGRSERSLLGLASRRSGGRGSHLGGLVCGVVTNLQDPDSKGKVKVALPWLAPDFETDWARVVQLSAGPRTGAMFMPEVGDEVLVGFEYGDMRRPYVIGGLINDNAKYSSMDGAVDGGGAVVARGIASPAGNILQFKDELPPGPPGAAPPTTSQITLGTGDGNLGLVIDQVGGTVTFTCNPAPPKSQTPAGTVTIDCSGAGKIEIKSGSGGLKLTTDGQLELNGGLGVKIESNAMVQVKGQMVQLN